ncbi:hypothetical protein G7Y79_00013g035900 [Physcia stellaris]|nr:hypothetical protein G7Y79_00013g035900 [Physcia stellaris]
MDDQQNYGDPFAIPDFWENSRFAPTEEETQGPLLEDLDTQAWQSELLWEKLDYIEKPLPELIYERPYLIDLEFGPLDDFHHEPLEDIGGSTPSLSEIGTNSTDDDDHFWLAPELRDEEKSHAKSRSAGSVFNDNAQHPRSNYSSEVRPDVIDGILSWQSSKPEVFGSERSEGQNLKAEPGFAGLVNLILGLESTMFRYNVSEQTFESQRGSTSLSSYSRGTLASLMADSIAFANRLRNLQVMVEELYTVSKSSRSHIAIACYLSNFLLMLKASLSQSSRDIQSLFQFKELIREPNLLLGCFEDLISQCRNVNEDEEIIAILYGFAQQSGHSTSVHNQLLGMLHHGTAPWLLSLSNWLGLPTNGPSPDDGVPAFALKVAASDERGREETRQEWEFDITALPSFIDSSDGEVMLEVGQGLRLLRAHKAEHPLVHVESPAFEAPAVAFQFSWQDIERIEAQAKIYESNVLAAIKRFDIGGRPTSSIPKSMYKETLNSFDCKRTSDVAPEAYIASSIAQIEMPLPDSLGQKQDCSGVVRARLSESTVNVNPEQATSLGPPLSRIPSLSFSPIVSAQARLINQSTLRLLFKDHGLRSHLVLQYRYQLLGDSVFASNLSHALFDADSPLLGLSGLRPGSRTSSEFRLMLMGILSDSYHKTDISATHGSRGLPGGLSFAVRAMSETELQEGLDPNSISAFDFLRLQYKPPSPIDTAISPSSLEMYDTIFKLLLRLNRMMYAVTHFSRPDHNIHSVNQRFKIEAHHFVSCICSYLFENVTSIWSGFSKKLEKLERRIERYEVGEHDCLSRMRSMHEGMLDELMFALLLRKQHEIVMELLEEIFMIVLTFAKKERECIGEDMNDDHKNFAEKVREFVEVCRGLSERKTLPNGDLVEDDGIARLLLKLEISGYYSNRDE